MKGVIHPEDAGAAVKAGVAAIVVSNHGGRQMDGCAGTASVLRECVVAARQTAAAIGVDEIEVSRHMHAIRSPDTCMRL